MSVMSNRAFLNTAYTQLYSQEFRSSTADYADRANTALAQISTETSYYNDDLVGGKWREMMTEKGTTSPAWGFNWPKPSRNSTLNSASGLGVEIEGDPQSGIPGLGGVPHFLPTFDPYGTSRHWIDLYSEGSGGQVHWSATTSDPWIKLNEIDGSFDRQERVWVSIDWAKLPKPKDEDHTNFTGTIHISAGGSGGYQVGVNVSDPIIQPSQMTSIVEGDGYVSLLAEHSTRSIARNGAQWQSITGLGRIGNSMAVFPTTTPSVTDAAQVVTQSPEMDYDFTATTAGTVQLTVYAIPTHRTDSGRGLRYAAAIDDETPAIEGFDQNAGDTNQAWSENVIHNTAITTTKHTIATAGKHTLKIFMVDPGVVLEKFVISSAPLPASDLGPPKTVAR
jgi:hypothetical protein